MNTSPPTSHCRHQLSGCEVVYPGDICDSAQIMGMSLSTVIDQPLNCPTLPEGIGQCSAFFLCGQGTLTHLERLLGKDALELRGVHRCSQSVTTTYPTNGRMDPCYPASQGQRRHAHPMVGPSSYSLGLPGLPWSTLEVDSLLFFRMVSRVRGTDPEQDLPFWERRTHGRTIKDHSCAGIHPTETKN